MTGEHTYKIFVTDQEGTVLIVREWDSANELLVGRADEMDLQLRDPDVSRRHCRLKRENGRILLEDLDSTSGTMHRGDSVDRLEIRPGAVFEISGYRLHVENGESAGLEGERRIKPEKSESGRVLFQTLRRVINSELHLEELLQVLIESMGQAAGAWRGFVILREEDGQLVPGATYVSEAAESISSEPGEEENITEEVMNQFSRSLIDQVMESGEPILTDNAAEDPALTRHSTVQKLSLKSLLIVPIRDGDEPIGAVYLDNPAAVKQFDESDLEIANQIAEEVAGSVAGAKQFRDVREELSTVRNRFRKTQKKLQKTYDYDRIIGESDAIQEVYRMLDRVIPTEMNVVIEGETGTGKELVANEIHYNGPRADGPFLAVNCARSGSQLLESELFGHKKGAFTGARREKPGLFEQSDGGTLFLDEVGDMSSDMQAKLLRVMETQTVRRLGGERERPVDVRILCATNQPLPDLMDEGSFRKDLYYRLKEARILLPPLRKRTEDIPLLVDHFLEEIIEEEGLPEKSLSSDAMSEMAKRKWPGNVRELRNAVRQLAQFTGDEETIEVEHVQTHLGKPEQFDSGRDEYQESDQEPETNNPAEQSSEPVRNLEKVEEIEIRKALEKTGGNQRVAADLLGIHRSTLHRKMKKYDIEKP